MANPFDIANFNLTNFAQVLPDVLDSVPKTVEYTYKDANGNIKTKNVENRGLFKKHIWDDVGGALGQFNRTFYVDAENGDNNNTGSSNSPFKTLSKALNSIPYGGRGVVVLLTDLELANEPSPIQIGGKIIYLKLNGHTLSKINTDNMLYASDFFTFLKVSNGNTENKANIIIRNDDTVTSTRKGLLSVVDGSATMVVGDWDSDLDVNIDDGLIYSFRGYAEGGLIKTNFKSNNGIPVIWSDNSNVNFKQNNCNFTNTKLTNYVTNVASLLQPHRSISIFVDSINGSNSNVGYMQTSPVKTIKQALALTRSGIRNFIFLLNDAEINEYTELYSRDIMFRTTTDNPDAKLTINSTTGASVLYLKASTSIYFNLDVEVKNTSGNGSFAYPIVALKNCVISFNNHIARTTITGGIKSINIEIGAYTALSRARYGANISFWSNDIETEDDNYYITTIEGSAIFSCILSTVTLNGEAITVDTLRNKMTGIARDADGKVLNVLTALNL